MAPATAVKGVITIDGHELTISNPDKLLWPEEGITKLMYLQKLILLSPYLIRYCANRYLTTIRWPDGINGKSFYQKNSPEPIPEFVSTSMLNGINYVNLDSTATLLWLGNLACLEFHPSFHAIGETLPCEWLIDIDPSREEEPRIMEAASIVGELLEGMNIRSIAKTSGATGVQIYVPIAGRYTFEQLRRIGEFLGKYLVERHPRLFTIERLKKDRGDHIYFDYLQHWHGKTLSAPYTPRARKNAPVSTPLTWEEVKGGADPRDFNLFTIERRLAEHGDLLEQIPPQSLEHVLEFLQKGR
jgi:bifunctional non-homologous end joining protein LigD